MDNNRRPVAVFALSHPWVHALVREIGQRVAPDIEVRFLDDRNQEEIARLLPQATFLVSLKLPPAWTPLLKHCRLVQANGVGYDAFDLAGLRAAGIPFAISPKGTAEGVAEHTILLILALCKQLYPVHDGMRQGIFDMFGWRRDSISFQGKTLGIVGLGRIGRRVAHLAYAFGARTIYNDLIRAPQELESRLELTRVSFDEAISQADVVSVHVPLTPLTRRMFASAEFARMKPGAIYINTSRGGTYDLDALYESLKLGQLRGAGLDVFEPEPPPPDHPLLQLPNVICTPHMASGTLDRHRAIAEGQFANFHRVLRDETPHDLVRNDI